MTEYEAAMLALQEGTLALQEGTLALQEKALALQERALTIQWVQVGMSGLQALLITAGIWLMWRGGQQRDDLHRETMTALDNQHRATMRALEALIERTAPQKQ